MSKLTHPLALSIPWRRCLLLYSPSYNGVFNVWIKTALLIKKKLTAEMIVLSCWNLSGLYPIKQHFEDTDEQLVRSVYIHFRSWIILPRYSSDFCVFYTVTYILHGCTNMWIPPQADWSICSMCQPHTYRGSLHFPSPPTGNIWYFRVKAGALLLFTMQLLFQVIIIRQFGDRSSSNT